MKSMINYLMDSLTIKAIRFLRKRGYKVISTKEYDYLNSQKDDYMAPPNKIKEGEITNKETNKESDYSELVKDDIISRVKDLITKLENNDFTNNLITSEPDETLHDETIKHMHKLIELVETKSYKEGSLDEIIQLGLDKEATKRERHEHLDPFFNQLPPELQERILAGRYGDEEKDLDI